MVEGSRRGRPPEDKSDEDYNKGAPNVSQSWDEGTLAMLFEGATVTQLSHLFEMNAHDITRKIRPVKACGKRRGWPIWKVRAVAGYLVPPTIDIDTYISKMNLTELPATLRKEFWQAQLLQQKFEENEGDLWRTTAVMEVTAAVFAELRMNIMLLSDRVQRETALSEQQRTIILRITDGMIEEIRANIIERFDDRKEQLIQSIDGHSIDGRDDGLGPLPDPAEGL